MRQRRTYADLKTRGLGVSEKPPPYRLSADALGRLDAELDGGCQSLFLPEEFHEELKIYLRVDSRLTDPFEWIIDLFSGIDNTPPWRYALHT